MNTEDIEFGYCTEFMVKLDSGKRNFNEDAFRQDLSRFGDSLLVVSDEISPRCTSMPNIQGKS
ncbi:hypothetical protein PO124_01050 [Bacillus licheniformis]|nr:hypothetical protein [Bacillus licheniformis]